jgi:hypothetical protein
MPTNEETLHSGITAATPNNILFGAGTFHKGLTFGTHYALTSDTTMQTSKTYYEISGGSSGGVSYSTTSDTAFASGKSYYEQYTGWNKMATVIGATSGGTKVSIKPEFKDIEVDGATVKVKGLAVKVGETASMETNLIEVTSDTLKSAVVGATNANTVATGYTEIVSTTKINPGDYIGNLGFIGETLAGKPVVVIFGNALCTSGLDFECKNKESSSIKVTFECYEDLTTNPVTLPYHIYYPTV